MKSRHLKTTTDFTCVTCKDVRDLLRSTEVAFRGVLFHPEIEIFSILTAIKTCPSHTDNARKTVHDVVESSEQDSPIVSCQICCPDISFNH